MRRNLSKNMKNKRYSILGVWLLLIASVGCIDIGPKSSASDVQTVDAESEYQECIKIAAENINNTKLYMQDKLKELGYDDGIDCSDIRTIYEHWGGICTDERISAQINISNEGIDLLRGKIRKRDCELLLNEESSKKTVEDLGRMREEYEKCYDEGDNLIECTKILQS
jgi:hypothetical protein